MEVGNIAKAASFKSFLHLSYSTAQKIGFSINDFFAVNVTKSAVFCGFGHIY